MDSSGRARLLTIGIADLKTEERVSRLLRTTAAGNLCYDGVYAYQYDAWNRLVSVHTAGLVGILCQFDSAGTAIWVLQDEGGDVVAAADNGGANATARRVGLWSYGPYGEVVRAVTTVSHAPIHAGHKGLFLDRLDLGVALPGGIENPRLGAGGTWAVYANNRHLLPKYGRWAQMDPNSSGLAIIGDAAKQRQGIPAGAGPLDLDRLYADGLGLYQYVQSNTWNRGDPLGLSGEWDELIDFGLNFIPSWGIEAYVRTGVLAYRIARDLTEAYSLNLSGDLEWTNDWVVGEDQHTRLDSGWITDVYRQQWDEYNSNVDPTGGLVLAGKGKGALKSLEGFADGGPGIWIPIRIQVSLHQHAQPRDLMG